ncbi:hypothetical protein H4R20_006301 [Coemansia guatemalensis]|uniref:Uncharacterized protein n=1 Tax=Coemansia guatemalensis TaxID=2761395 RepID=A0A9W8HW70_9FUNG|nr:hypothetical protein H4R20_006301 [Coemansia guatemalensis]
MVPISFYTKPQRSAPDHASKKQKNTLSAEQIQALATLKQTSGTSSGSTSTPKRTARISPKIELMRLRARATGNSSIDMADRLYLSVVWKGKSTPVFINKSAMVGSSAMEFARNLHLSTLSSKVYRLKNLDGNVLLPSNKTFNELLDSNGEVSSKSDVELFNGCSLELICLNSPEST